MIHSANTRIAISTVGSCVILVDGKVVSGVPTIFYKVAAYLLLAGTNGSVTRQRLWSALWSDPRDADRAAANLRRSLARIRALQAKYGFALIESNFHTVYLVEDAQVSWDLKRLWGILLDQGQPVRLGSYPGELLADIHDSGPEFEDWLGTWRETLRGRFLDRLAQSISDESWASKNGPTRRALAQEILSVDPCNEEAFRILMIDAAASRNAARLKQVYQRCETELRHELNVAISAETRTLYEGLMRSITN